jgi:hypothetical protein
MGNTAYQDMMQKQIEMVGNKMLSVEGEMPEIGKQIISSGIAYCKLWMKGWCTLCFAFLFLAMLSLLKWGLGNWLFYVEIFFAVASFCLAVDAKGDLLKIHASPKIYVLDELRSRLG